MPKVHFSYADKQLNYSSKKALKRFVETIFSKEKKQLGCIRYIFCSDEYLLAINRTALNHDYYTDIITFDLSESNQPIDSEVYISIDRVKDNAIQQQVSFQDELCRVVFHGALHLCGYKDKKKEDILMMRKKEDYYLKMFTGL